VLHGTVSLNPHGRRRTSVVFWPFEHLAAGPLRL